MFELKKIAPAIYELAKTGGMRVPNEAVKPKTMAIPNDMPR